MRGYTWSDDTGPRGISLQFFQNFSETKLQLYNTTNFQGSKTYNFLPHFFLDKLLPIFATLVLGPTYNYI